MILAYSLPQNVLYFLSENILKGTYLEGIPQPTDNCLGLSSFTSSMPEQPEHSFSREGLGAPLSCVEDVHMDNVGLLDSRFIITLL